MENIRPIHYGEIIKRDWRMVLVITLITLILSFVVTLLQPFLYSSTVSVLVLQKSGFSIDAYSASKSEERIANKLSQVVYSSSFLSKVLNSGFSIDKTYFPSDELKKRKQWQSMVETSVPAGLSKLQVSVYHKDPNQALQIAQAIAFTLTSEKREYIGIDDVDLRVLDAPLASKYPVKPNIILNLGLGLIVGIFFGVIYVIISYNPNRDKLLSIPDQPAATKSEAYQAPTMLVPNDYEYESAKVEVDNNDEEIREEEISEGGQPTSEELNRN